MPNNSYLIRYIWWFESSFEHQQFIVPICHFNLITPWFCKFDYRIMILSGNKNKCSLTKFIKALNNCAIKKMYFTASKLKCSTILIRLGLRYSSNKDLNRMKEWTHFENIYSYFSFYLLFSIIFHQRMFTLKFVVLSHQICC